MSKYMYFLESHTKIKKYQVLYKLDNVIELTSNHYIDKNDWDKNNEWSDDSWRYTFIKMIEESEQEFTIYT